METLRIAAVCLIAAVLAKVVQPTNRDLAALISISAVIFAAFAAFSGISDVVSGIGGIISRAGISGEYISVAFRALGICYICELCSSSCRDCGETALGSVLDITGRIAVALMCLPLIGNFIEVAERILER